MGSGSSSAQTHTVDADAASSDAGSSASHAGPPVKVATKHGSGKLHKESMHKARGLESKGCHGTGSSCGTARVHLVAEKAMVQVQYAAQTRGVLGKDQDRYALHVPSGGKHGLALGIFDGHSVHGVEGGRQHAASAATQLPAALMRAVSKTAGSVGAASGPQTSHPSCASSQRALMGEDEPLVAAVAAEFSALQRGIEQRYRKQVTGRLMAAKAKLEAEIGEEMSLALPQEGGTTATAVVIRPKGIVAAWVGDSRAVLGLREPAPARGDGGVDCSGAVRALPLTNDHNLEDERERSRLLACGGKTGVGEMARTHVFVRGAEGTLRVTRSIGDTPFHREKAVSSIPDVTFHPLNPSTYFLVIASDGIWDLMDCDAVVSAVADDLARPLTGDFANAAAAACDALIARAVALSESRGSSADDMSVAIALFCHS